MFVNKKEYTTQYDDLTVCEIIELYKNFGDKVIIHNGHIIGFTKD